MIPSQYPISNAKLRVYLPNIIFCDVAAFGAWPEDLERRAITNSSAELTALIAGLHTVEKTFGDEISHLNYKIRLSIFLYKEYWNIHLKKLIVILIGTYKK